MKKTISLSLLLSLLVGINLAQAAEFSDVNEDYLYYKSINNLTESGCINGYEDGTFKPDKEVTRAEAVKILLTCIDLPKIYTEQTFTVPEGTILLVDNSEKTLSDESEVKFKIPFNAENYADLSFDDIKENSWYIPFLKEAVVRKIITGYDDNTIKPNQSVNKAELYTILYRLTPEELLVTNTEESLADDIASGFWYYEPLQFAIENQLLTTNDENLINPFKELTRANVAHFVYEYSEWLNDRIVTDEDSNESEESTEEDKEQTDTEETNNEDESNQENEPESDEETNTEDSSSQTDTNTEETNQLGFTETGVASYYGYSFDGRRTASGQILDVEANMAAHKTLPFGSIVRITNPDTGKWVEVTIFDRGPFVEGRIIDLTPSSFEAIAPLSSGIVNVELEVISLPE